MLGRASQSGRLERDECSPCSGGWRGVGAMCTGRRGALRESNRSRHVSFCRYSPRRKETFEMIESRLLLALK